MVSVTRVLVLGCATMAASRYNLTATPPPIDGLCGRDPLATLSEHCLPADAAIHPEHVFLPLLLPCTLALVVNIPTLLLPSRFRARQLRVATAHVLGAWGAVALCAYAYRTHPALAYGLALHSTVFLLSLPPDPGVLIGPGPEQAARWACVALLLLGAQYLGPPLPVLDVPGLSRCCGSTAHLLALLLPDAAIGLAIEVVLRVLPP